MKTGISTASFYPRYLTEDALDRVGELGIKGCEVFLETFSEYQPSFANLLCEKMKKYGLIAYSVHSLSSQFEPQLFSATERQRKDARDVLKKVFDTAQRIGAKTYVFHGPANLKQTNLIYHYESLGENTAYLAELAASFGLQFSWENVHWCYFNHPEFAENLLKHIHHKNLYFTLDIKQAMQAGIDPFLFLEAMGKHLAHVHVCDYDIDGNLAMPGKGIFDFKRLYRELKILDYQGPLILEVYQNNYRTMEDIKKSYAFLQNIFSEKKH